MTAPLVHNGYDYPAPERLLLNAQDAAFALGFGTLSKRAAADTMGRLEVTYGIPAVKLGHKTKRYLPDDLRRVVKAAHNAALPDAV